MRAAYAQKNLPEARKLAEKALARFARSDAEAIWDLRLLRVEILVGMSEKRLALSEVTKLETLARVHRHPERRPAILFWKGRILTSLERYEGAIKAARELIRASEGAAAKYRGSGWAALGLALGKLSRFEEAADADRNALEEAEKSGNSPLALSARQNLGWALSESGDLEAAEKYSLATEQEAAAKGKAQIRFESLLILGDIENSRHADERALDYYRRAEKCASDEIERARALTGAAQAELNLGRLEAAKQDNAVAIEIKQRTADASLLNSLILDGEIAQKEQRFDDADALYTRVAAKAPTSLMKWTAEVYRALLYNERKQPAKAEAAFKRALSLIDTARAEVKSLEAKISYNTLVANFFDDYINVLVSANRKEEALHVADLARGRALAETVDAKFDPKGNVARSGVIALEYAFGGKRSYLWVVTPKAITTFILPPREELDRRIDEYTKSLKDVRGTLALTQAGGERLYKLLVEPAAALIPPNAHVAIAGDGHLNEFNMETIVVPQPRPHYWIEDVEIEVVSSLRALGRANTPKAAGGMLIIGDAPPADGFAPLPQAAQEIQQVKSAFPSAKVLSGPAATPAAYVASSPKQYAYVHFVAHGVANKVAPFDSAVILARSPDGDYKLYAREIVRHPLSARLVTVSSCVSAGTRRFEGEGLVGVAWAFLRAGAGQVVAALWEVSDAVTPRLMNAMYDAIRRGDDAPAALRKAKLRLLHLKDTNNRAYYWAPFVVYSAR